MSAVEDKTISEMRANAIAAAAVLATIMLAAWLWTVLT